MAEEVAVVPAPRDRDSRTRVSAGRYRADPPREPCLPRAHHSTRPAAPPLVRLSAAQVVGGAVVATAAVVAYDLTLTERLSMFFDLSFVLVGLCAALLVRHQGLFAAGVLPPLLMGAVVAVLAAVSPATLTASHLAFVSTWLTGLAHHAAALATTHVVVLTVVGLRAAQRPRSAGPPDV